MEQYVMGPVIGEGAYGKVRLAKKNEKTVAVKIMSKKAYQNDNMEEFLQREIEIMQSMKHENIVQMHEVVETEKQMFIVMEYVKGGDLLSKLMENGALSESEAKSTFMEIVNAVAYCHSQSVAHRDLKLENVLLRKDGHAKVADFGFAVKMESVDSMEETFCGSAAYSAPEVMNGVAYNPMKSDIWSLGVMLYAMVFGCFPTSEVSFPESSVSASCRNLICKMLEVDLEKRANFADILESEWFNL